MASVEKNWGQSLCVVGAWPDSNISWNIDTRVQGLRTRLLYSAYLVPTYIDYHTPTLNYNPS